MQTIVITGPSGSGKSYLSKNLSKLFCNSIIIKTDSYYRDNKLIQLLAIIMNDIYDRPLSIKKKEIKTTLRSINSKERFISLYRYDFIRKKSSQSIKGINYQEDNQFLILEGIFAHRLDLNYKKSINIICEAKKDTCLQRRLKRDQSERGRDRREVCKRFNQSWYLFYKNVHDFLNINHVLSINTLDKYSTSDLLLHLKKFNN